MTKSFQQQVWLAIAVTPHMIRSAMHATPKQWRAQDLKFGYSKIYKAKQNDCFIPVITIYTFGYTI